VAHKAGFTYEGRRLAECGHADGRRTDAWAAALVPGVEAEPWPYEPFTELSDGDLTLRRWQPADAELLVELEADPAVLGWSGPLASSRREVAEAADDIAGRVAEDFLLGRAARLAVCVEDEPVGGASLRTPGLAQGVGEMGWWLGAAGRGRGIGTRAVRLLAAWGFERLGLRRISAGIHVENVASRALAERVGFVPEGVRRQGAPAFGPGWGDAIAHAMVPTDLR
jgi:RimJ/RimL family protein N-acetyltransferase